MGGKTQPQFSFVPVNGMHLHVAEAGPKDGPLLILLHGFPEFWFGWRRQIGPLAEAGYRVIVPDQRGYNLSSKPNGVSSYRLDALAGDVIALADHYGAERFHLAGHDWGAIVAWWVAQEFAERVKACVTLNAGHPAVWRARIKNDREQRKKSFYVAAFRLPLLPEAMMRARNFKVLADAVCATAKPGTVSDAELACYRDAWGREHALRSMVNWYRAIGRADLKPPQSYRIAPPMLTIWGAKDVYGTVALAEDSVALCDHGRLRVFDNATHWVLADAPERVIEDMLEFFAAA